MLSQLFDVEYFFLLCRVLLHPEPTLFQIRGFNLILCRSIVVENCLMDSKYTRIDCIEIQIPLFATPRQREAGLRGHDFFFF